MEITGEAWLTPYPITIPSGEVQGVGNVSFLLPPTWTPSMEDGLFYAYTEEDHGAASCGRLLFAVNTLPDSDVADPEALLRYLATSDEDATMTKLFMTRWRAAPPSATPASTPKRRFPAAARRACTCSTATTSTPS